MDKPQSMRKRRQAERQFEPPEIEPLNARQATLLRLLLHHECVVAVGPAGTGKTYLACAFAADRLRQRQSRKVVLTRPNVGVGRTLGFAPGTIERKLAPWVRPFTEALKSRMSAKQYDEAITAGAIEPLAFEHVRGLTFDDAVVIVDEAQNLTLIEAKAITTRLGQRSRLVLLGDVTQSDITGTNGLELCTRAIDAGLVPGAALVHFSHVDIVRSPLCAAWQAAFDHLSTATATA